VCLVVFVLVTALLDRAGAFGYRGDDWARYERKSVNVRQVLAGDQIIIIDEIGREDSVQLLGIDAADEGEHWFERSLAYTEARIAGKAVMLKLDTTQTRDDFGRLRAFVYLSANDNINLDLVRNGMAYADRRVMHMHRAEFEQLETAARQKGRGLWAEVREEQMPAWRQAWLREHYRRRAELRGR
jgi:endonuclease YncB( thermonuclease family)